MCQIMRTHAIPSHVVTNTHSAVRCQHFCPSSTPTLSYYVHVSFSLGVLQVVVVFEPCRGIVCLHDDQHVAALDAEG